MTLARCQALHLQSGVQVAPGRHLHEGPHLQAGPHAQDIPLFLAATLGDVDFGSRPLLVEFILMLLWIGDWTGVTLSIRGSKQLNETAKPAERWQARFRTFS